MSARLRLLPGADDFATDVLPPAADETVEIPRVSSRSPQLESASAGFGSYVGLAVLLLVTAVVAALVFGPALAQLAAAR